MLRRSFFSRTNVGNIENIISGQNEFPISESKNFLRLRTAAPVGRLFATDGVRGIVSAFDATSVTVLKTQRDDASFALAKIDRYLANQEYSEKLLFSIGDPLVDLHGRVSCGSVVAFTSEAPLHERRKFSDKIANFRSLAGDQVVRTRIADGASETDLFLDFLRIPRRAVTAASQAGSGSHKSGVTLILEDLEDYQLAFDRLQLEAGATLPVSFVQALNAALNVAAGNLTVLVFLRDADAQFSSAVGQAADRILALDACGSVTLHSALQLPEIATDRHACAARRVLAEEVRGLLSHGGRMKDNLALRRELKIHEDFWDTEELDNFETQLAILGRSAGNLLVVRAAIKYFFVGRNHHPYRIERFIRGLVEFFETNEPEIAQLCKTVDDLPDRDAVEAAFVKIDKALLRHRLNFELAVPKIV